MGHKSFIIAFLLIMFTYGVVHNLHLGTDVVVVNKNLNRLPYTINDFQGIDISLDENIVKILDTDVYLFRNYVSQGGAPITLYIGYYGTKKGGRSDHIPEGCYPGSGWSILAEGRTRIVIPGERWSRTVVLNTLEVKKDDATELVYHWYQSERDKVILSGLQQNMHRFMSRLMSNRDDGAFVRVSMNNHGDKARTRDDMERFIRELFPLIAEYWPQEEEIPQ